MNAPTSESLGADAESSEEGNKCWLAWRVEVERPPKQLATPSSNRWLCGKKMFQRSNRDLEYPTVCNSMAVGLASVV